MLWVRRGCGVLVVLSSLAAVDARAASDGAEALADSLEAAQQSLRASVAAHRQAQREFELRAGRGELTPREVEDYQAFLARLQAIVERKQRHLRARAEGMVPEPDVRPITPGSGAVQTEAERIVELESQLRASLAEFDEMLLDEMEELRHKARNDAEAGEPPGDMTAAAGGGARTATAGGSPAEKQAESTSQGGGADAASGSDAAEPQPGARDASARQSETVVQDANRSGAGAGRGPERRAELPDGSDDDVVARQLREAAERETDPELKEKLWEEYRRYKGIPGDTESR